MHRYRFLFLLRMFYLMPLPCNVAFAKGLTSLFLLHVYYIRQNLVDNYMLMIYRIIRQKTGITKA